MMNRVSLIAILLSVILVLCGWLLSGGADPRVTLADLAALDRSGSLSLRSHSTLEHEPSGNWVLASVEVDSLFYAVLAVCGAVVAIRIFVSALRTLHEERLLAQRRSARLGPRVETRTPPLFPEETADDSLETSGEAGGWRSHRSFALYPRGLTVRMIGTFTGIVAVFGLLVVPAVYFTVAFSLRKHILERARVMAFNVSDGAPAYLLKNNGPGLRELLRKHANRSELAYILVENRAGEVFAHSFAVLPEEVRGATSSDGDPAERTLQLAAGAVHEVSVAIMEGRIGKVRVGIWGEQIDGEINATVVPLIKLLMAVVGCAMAIAVFLAWRINRPIFRLLNAAKAISAGDLDTPSVRIEDATEFSELSRALERMRSSVKAAMVRLGR